MLLFAYVNLTLDYFNKYFRIKDPSSGYLNTGDKILHKNARYDLHSYLSAIFISEGTI